MYDAFDRPRHTFIDKRGEMVSALGKIMDPVVTAPVFAEAPNDIFHNLAAPRYKAILNPDTEKVISIMSDRYTLIPNADLLETTLDVLARVAPTTGWPKVTKAETINDGRQFFAEFSFPDLTFTPPDGKTISARLLMGGSYDGTKRAWFRLGSYRMVCSNGMVVGEDVLGVSQKHMGDQALERVLGRITNELGGYIRGMQSNMAEAIIPIAQSQRFREQHPIADVIRLSDPASFVGDDREELTMKALTKTFRMLPLRPARRAAKVLITGEGVALEGSPRVPWNMYNLMTNVITHESHGRLTESRRMQALSDVHTTILKAVA